MVQKKATQKAERKRESCQWKWAVLQEASGWACENHISLFLRTLEEKCRLLALSRSPPFQWNQVAGKFLMPVHLGNSLDSGPTLATMLVIHVSQQKMHLRTTELTTKKRFFKKQKVAQLQRVFKNKPTCRMEIILTLMQSGNSKVQWLKV